MLHIAAGVALGIVCGAMLLNSWASWQVRRQVRLQMRQWKVPAPPRPLRNRILDWTGYTVMGLAIIAALAAL
jgi:hypothetical protein